MLLLGAATTNAPNAAAVWEAIGTWVGALITGAALVIAAATLRYELAERGRERASARRADARALEVVDAKRVPRADGAQDVYGNVVGPPFEWHVPIKNSSDELFTWVAVRLKIDEWEETVWTESLWVREELPFVFVEPGDFALRESAFPLVTVSFDDHHGQRWTRKPSGELFEGDPIGRPRPDQPGRLSKSA